MPVAIVPAVSPANFECHNVGGRARWVIGGVLSSLKRSKKISRVLVLISVQEAAEPLQELWESLAEDGVVPPMFETLVVDPLKMAELMQKMVEDANDDDEIFVEIGETACYLFDRDVDALVGMCQEQGGIGYLGFPMTAVIPSEEGMHGPLTAYPCGALKVSKASVLLAKDIKFPVAVHPPDYFMSLFRYIDQPSIPILHRLFASKGSWLGGDYKTRKEIPPGSFKATMEASVRVAQEIADQLMTEAQNEGVEGGSSIIIP